MIVEYTEVIDMGNSYSPYYDYIKDNPKKDYSKYLFISAHRIEFVTPLNTSIDDNFKHLISLKRNDTITGYTNHLQEPLWKVTKDKETGTITLYPSVLWAKNDPKERQHFWLRDNKAFILNDSWIYQEVR